MRPHRGNHNRSTEISLRWRLRWAQCPWLASLPPRRALVYGTGVWDGGQGWKEINEGIIG